MSKKLLIGLSLAAVSVLSVNAFGDATAPGQGVVGSKHDMRIYGQGFVDPLGRVCAYCHSPHHVNNGAVGTAVTTATNTAGVGAGVTISNYNPLWSHDLSQIATWKEYQSDTFNQDGSKIIDPLVGPSRLCMSCHDGAVAVDSYYNHVGTSTVNFGDSYMTMTTTTYTRGDIGIGTGGDLSNDHPVGMIYTDFFGKPGYELRDPSTVIKSKAGGSISTIDGLMFTNRADGKKYMTCASCHDVHNNNNAGTQFLYVSQTNSAICLTCHDKAPAP